MVVYLTGLVSLLLAALSLGPSFAHVMEAPPRLFVWAPELWREATVFNGQFVLFAKVGGPLDVTTILAACFLSYLLANERPAFWFALAGAAFSLEGWRRGSRSSLRQTRSWPPGNRARYRRTSKRYALDGRRATWSLPR